MQSYYDKDLLEVGIDEVARGCMFGRVYTAAVIWPQDVEYDDDVRDSKKLSKKKREQLYDFIIENAIDYSINYSDEQFIDETSITTAVYNSMHKNLDNLTVEPDLILVDGNFFPQYKNKNHLCVIDGDATYKSIAAASILAKVEHDHYIEDICEEYPYLHEKYDLLNNMGYGTKKHMDGIKQYGSSDFHRKTYGICKNY